MCDNTPYGHSNTALIIACEREIKVLQFQVKQLQDEYKLLLDKLNLQVQHIPAQPAQQKLVEKGQRESAQREADGKNEFQRENKNFNGCGSQ